MATKSDYRRQKTPKALKLREIDRQLVEHDKKLRLALEMDDKQYIEWRREDHRLMEEWWTTFKSSDDLSIPF